MIKTKKNKFSEYECCGRTSYRNDLIFFFLRLFWRVCSCMIDLENNIFLFTKTVQSPSLNCWTCSSELMNLLITRNEQQLLYSTRHNATTSGDGALFFALALFSHIVITTFFYLSCRGLPIWTISLTFRCFQLLGWRWATDR